MIQDVTATYMTSPQAARILRITDVGVAQLARQGKIPAVKIANRWLVPRAFVEEFAKTYEGKRGRPRKKGPCAECPEALASATLPGQLGLADTSEIPEVRDSRHEAGDILAVNAQVDHLEEIPASATLPDQLGLADASEIPEVSDSRHEVGEIPAINAQVDRLEEPPASITQTQPADLSLTDTGAASEAEDFKREAEAALAMNTQVDHPEETRASRTPPGELAPKDTIPVSETEESKLEGDKTFAVSAEVYHLDKNYDFEICEKGEITEQARLIVARLKPKIPSLPQFSFRWDYRYEHLNVDIQGVEPAVIDWWTMGENGYTGHLPRRLGGPDRAFEAIIWLPVTFVFRGRLTLVLREDLATEEDSPSAAKTSGSPRKWWTKWPTLPQR